MIRWFRYVGWTLTQVEYRGVRAHARCVSGTPMCGAMAPAEPRSRSAAGVLAWVEKHMRETGHRRYDRALFDTVQWDPPAGIDPRTLPGVTT